MRKVRGGWRSLLACGQLGNYRHSASSVRRKDTHNHCKHYVHLPFSQHDLKEISLPQLLFFNAQRTRPKLGLKPDLKQWRLRQSRRRTIPISSLSF